MVGFAKKYNIYLFSPSVIEKVSRHKKSDVKKVLSHEICHMFNNQISKKPLMWIDEGLALFLSGQKKKKHITKKDIKFFYNNLLGKNANLKVFSDNSGYRISYWIVKYIVKILGRQKTFDLLKINSDKSNTKQTIEKKSEKIFENYEPIQEGQILARGKGTRIVADFDGHALFGGSKLKPDSIKKEVLFLSRPVKKMTI